MVLKDDEAAKNVCPSLMYGMSIKNLHNPGDISDIKYLYFILFSSNAERQIYWCKMFLFRKYLQCTVLQTSVSVLNYLIFSLKFNFY